MSVAFAALQLRDVASKFSRVETNAAICQELKVHCQLFFNTYSLLMKSVDPTVWTVRLSREFGFGLGINTMKGREAKHVTLSSFACHATLSTRWTLVMCHECKDKYVTKEAHLPEFCYCGFKLDENEAKCFYCSSSLYEAVSRSAQKGELDDEICNMLSVSS